MKLEDKYTQLSERQHILQRPGMWVGSVKPETSQRFLYSVDDAKMVLREISYTPALLKIIDEVVTNSCDEYRRKGNMGLNKIEVTITKSGHIEVKDNGGLPVQIHKQAGIYLPEFIFGQLRTSSNYNDTEERHVTGTNGLGGKICNVLSSKFEVSCADGSKSYKRSWRNNMEFMNDDMVVEPCNDHYVHIKFDIDFSKFDCGTELSDDFIDLIEKRCIDAAAANPGLTVVFNYKDGKKSVRRNNWHFRKFEHYIELFTDFVDVSDGIQFADKQKSVWMFPDGNINIGFVNGAECSKGSHIKAVRQEINNAVSDHIKSKHKMEIAARNVDNKYSLFCICNVANPAYSSQTKEELTTPVERFSMEPGYEFKIPNTFLRDVTKSDIVQVVIDWFKQKQEVEDQKTLRKLNRQAKSKVRNSDKFIDANSKKRDDRELWIFEGASASSGFRFARNPQTQAAYLLRGVIMNTWGLAPSKIMANRELSELINILGLQWGQKNDVTKLNFSKIIISTDADYDGNKISALLMVFFNLFPELYEAGMIYKSITPIVIARKGSDTRKYYKMDDFRKEQDSLKGYKFVYNKGLGSLTQDEYKDMMQTPVLHKITKDDLTDMNVKLWFGKAEAKARKATMKSEVS